MNNSRIKDDSINLEENETVSLKCFAHGVDPEPKFNWYLGNKDISSQKVEDSDNKYMDTLNYKANSADFGKKLGCKVTHLGCSDTNQRYETEVQLQMRYTLRSPKIGGIHQVFDK